MPDPTRPSLREAARRGASANRPAPTPAPRPAAPPQKVKPPVACSTPATARCGHAVPFELFEEKKDKFRDDRRKKLADRDCPDCRRQAGEAKQRAEQEAARLRRAERATAPPAALPDRLPHGSRFDVIYDAAKEEWSGTLTVPDATPGWPALVLTASASAVFMLLRRLDGLYRKAAATKPGDGADVNRDEGGEG